VAFGCVWGGWLWWLVLGAAGGVEVNEEASVLGGSDGEREQWGDGPF